MEQEVQIFELLSLIWQESKGYGILLTGAFIVWKMRKNIGESVTSYVDEFKKDLIKADKDSMTNLSAKLVESNNQHFASFKEEVSKSLEQQLEIVKKLIDSNQVENKKILDAIDMSINALNIHTEELAIVIQRQGWTEEAIQKIKAAMERANLKIEDIGNPTDSIKPLPKIG